MPPVWSCIARTPVSAIARASGALWFLLIVYQILWLLTSGMIIVYYLGVKHRLVHGARRRGHIDPGLMPGIFSLNFCEAMQPVYCFSAGTVIH